jgi:hypothetical protein
VGGVPALQVPDWQVSAPLHALLSEHDVPLATAVFTQPVAGLQESVVHGFPSLQFGAVPAVQLPDWQVSSPLQALPSEHEAPLATGVTWQPVTALHVSVVQGFESLQLSAVPAVQVPV